MEQNITLDNFEQIIDHRILERGFEYYKNDAILTIEQVDHGLWEAIISGNQKYDVSINIKDQIIVNSSCNCPYDMSDFCKHKVAVLNFLKYNEGLGNFSSFKMDKIKSIIENFSPEEVKDNLLEILKLNRQIRDDFLKEYEEL